jgi:HD-GYP domain-containing protein (c-di-GMP phosphodiesterase class II)
MHDLGKIMVEDNFLNKPGSLNDAEWFSMRRHAESGYRIFSGVQEYISIAESVLAHHERWDGTGYPSGLAGNEIPLKARIIAIAEAYHTMITDRPYQKAVDKSTAIREMEKSAGTQFDPYLTKVFANMVQELPEVFPLDL